MNQTTENIPAFTFDPACSICHGTGTYCAGHSGREDDGNAPILEQCDCFIPVTAPVVEAATPNNLVPGKMRCAKCDFVLLRRVLYAGNGAVGAGTSETEPCPNGCGPLWPVTWEQEARECWDRMEGLFNDGMRRGLERAAEKCEQRACSVGPFHSAAARQCKADIESLLSAEPAQAVRVEAPASTPEPTSRLHEAICQAVTVMNTTVAVASDKELRKVHGILRAALADYVEPKSEQQIIAEFLERTGQYVTNDASREAAIRDAIGASGQKGPPAPTRQQIDDAAHRAYANGVASGMQWGAGCPNLDNVLGIARATVRALSAGAGIAEKPSEPVNLSRFTAPTTTGYPMDKPCTCKAPSQVFSDDCPRHGNGPAARPAAQALTETQRLTWLLHRLSGRDLRQAGVVYSVGTPNGIREAIDKAMAATDVRGAP